jgi:hypothetical protein
LREAPVEVAATGNASAMATACSSRRLGGSRCAKSRRWLAAGANLRAVPFTQGGQPQDHRLEDVGCDNETGFVRRTVSQTDGWAPRSPVRERLG